MEYLFLILFLLTPLAWLYSMAKPSAVPKLPVIKLTLVILLLLFISLFQSPSNASAHPGGTAADGCHYCRTNCAKWGEIEGARHCHGGSSAPAPVYYTSTPIPTATPFPTATSSPTPSITLTPTTNNSSAKTLPDEQSPEVNRSNPEVNSVTDYNNEEDINKTRVSSISTTEKDSTSEWLVGSVVASLIAIPFWKKFKNR